MATIQGSRTIGSAGKTIASPDATAVAPPPGLPAAADGMYVGWDGDTLVNLTPAEVMALFALPVPGEPVVEE